MSSALIIIDVLSFDVDGSQNSNRIANIITKFIDTHDDISTVILASYGCGPTENDENLIWYKNKKEFFNNSENCVDPGYYDPPWFPFQTTHPVLASYKNDRLFQIAIRHLREFTFFYNTYCIPNNIDSFIYAGGNLSECILTRPVGIYNLYNTLNIKNIFTDNRIFTDTISDIMVPSKNYLCRKNEFCYSMDTYKDWVQVSDNRYLYEPKLK